MGRGKNGTGKILLVTAQLSVYAWRQSSEATCSSQINTARAVAKEFGIQATGKSGVLSWASISLKNSERGTQKVVSEQGTKLDVEISSMIAKGTEVPWIPPTTWFKYLLDHGLWYRLAGLDFEKQHLAPEVWGKFWKQFEALQPDFSLFTMGFSEQELERTCAIFTHGDEGRTLKKNGIMITAVQSVLGYGFDEARLKKRGTKRAANGDELPHLEVNFAGHTFTNRFITSVIPKVLYEQDSDVFHAAMEELTLDLKRLLEDGIRDRHGNVFRVCCIGVKGDWPYLQKVGRLNRAFNTSVKRGAEAKKPRGVCHLCLAGRENFPSEEITTFRPRWLSTVGVLEPWDKRPVHIRFLPHDISNPGSFFMPDLWHGFHLGVGKAFASSVIQVCLPQVPVATLPEKWEWLTEHYFRFCKANHRPAIVRQISAYLVSYNDYTGAVGCWSKGAVTTSLLLWLPHLISCLPPDSEGLLAKASRAAVCANVMFSTLYESPAMLPKVVAVRVSKLGATFLQIYYKLATVHYHAGKPFLFPLYTKLHAMHHQVIQLDSDARRVGFAFSPLLTACQQHEDIVGRASRLNRRVSIKSTMLRTLQRYLIQSYVKWVDARMIRG